MEVAGIFLGPIIQVLLDKLVSPAVSTHARREGIDGQLKKFANMLPAIRAVLAHAEEKQMENDPAVKSWMEDLTDLAYDLDDLLDDFATETLRRQLMTPESHASSSTSSKVRKLIPTTPVKLYRNMRSKKTSKKDTRSKIEDITKRFQDIEERKNILNLKEIAEGIGSKTIRGGRETTSLVYKSEVYGRVQDQEAIVEELLRDEVCVDNFSVIPIVGMGGLGKTTLAQLVYDDDRVKGHFDLKVWVCVSDDFHAYVHRVTKTVLVGVTSTTHDSKSLEMLQQNLKENLSGKKFLLVLDDVWNDNYEDWQLLKLPFKVGAIGSKIIVTTRNESVAKTMTLSRSAYHLNVLSKDECLSLFARHALDKESFDADPALKEIGEKIVNNCKGLPLAVKILAGLLRTKGPTEWVDILNSKIWDLPQQIGILPALKLSYLHLPSHLKQCFAYCATFPKDYEFDKDELVLLWMGVGLLQPTKGNNGMEDFGYKCFADLLSRSFFQQSGGSKSRFVMHDLLNDLAQHVAGKICFRLDKLEGDEQIEIPEKARHLSFIRQEYEVLQKFRPLCNVQHLRTLLPLLDQIYWRQNSYLAKKVLFDLLPNLLCLRVLSLSSYCITELPDSIGHLKHLRYLNLSRTSVRRLPESVSTLYNLETLMLCNCKHLCMLPLNIGNLIKLRHLDISNTVQLREMCPRIGLLTKLQTLSKFVVGKSNGARLKELRNLKLLRGSISIEELQNITDVRDAIEANLKDKECHNEVELAWCSEFNNFRNESLEFDVLEKLQPHRNLERLKIKFYGGTKFPSWIGDPSLSKMVKLTLVGCRKCKYLPSLGQLPMLKELRIQSMHEVEKLGDEFYGSGVPFPSLESLIFEDMPAWEEWSSCIFSGLDKAARQFPCLVKHSLRGCPKLITVSLSRLPFLNKLHLEECKDVVLKSIVDVTALTSLKVVNIIGLCHLEEASVQSLVALESLVVEKCNQLVSLWENGVPCINLEELKIIDCVNLEKLPKELSKFTSLTSLKIDGCSKLVCFPKAGVPSTLRILEIRYCNVLESLPEGISGLEKLKISDCESLRSWPIKNMLPTTLKVLDIWNCKNLELVSETMMTQQQEDLNNINIIMSSLEELSICYDWPNIGMLLGCVNNFARLRDLSINDCDSLGSLPTNQIFQNLESLDISHCDSLKSFPEERGRLSTPNLRSLVIISCAKLSSLPIDEIQSLASLERIWIYDCPCLESFPQRQFSFSPNLIDLAIGRLGKVVKPLSEWGLHRLISLQSFTICGVYPELVSFPTPDDDDCLLPTSLTELEIKDLPNLKNISCKGFQNLTSLQHLTIEDCPKLRSLPKGGLPSTLHRLQIKKCPHLQKWCSDGGDYWPNIAHIPRVQLDNDSDIHSDSDSD